MFIPRSSKVMLRKKYDPKFHSVTKDLLNMNHRLFLWDNVVNLN